MILAIGIVVDDAIVVVEGVEHIMETEKLTPYEATKESDERIIKRIDRYFTGIGGCVCSGKFSEWNYRAAVSSVYGNYRGICTDFYCGCFNAESCDVFAHFETG